MIRRLPLAVAVALAVPVPGVAGQLPYLTAPRGTLRIELGGRFDPTASEFADGARRDFGDPIAAAALNAAGSPMVRDLEARIGALLGRPATAGSLGALSADAMLQRGAGLIGLAAGITDRVTAFARIPIVSVRTEVRLEHDPAGATLGLNPALLGDQASAQFLAQFDGALDELAARITAGDYAGDPALQELATRTLSEGGALRDALTILLVGTDASPVLPTAASADGGELLTTVAAIRDRFGSSLGISGFTAAPGLPSAPITAAGFDALVGSPAGLDLAPFDQQPLVGIGDVEVGVVALLASSRSEIRRSWFGAWLSGSVTLPTGTPPDPRFLRDAGTGDGQLDVALGATIEAGRGSLGIRATGSYRMQLEGSREVRVGRRDEFLLPAYRGTTLDWNPGDVLELTAEPFLRLADRLAIVGAATWIQRGEDRWTLPGGDPPAGTGNIAAMSEGTSASALRLGLGMSYAHAGHTRTGEQRMPVEAGLAIERTVSSGSGMVPAPLTTRMWLRVYKRLW